MAQRILLAEDNPQLAVSIAELLSRHGYEVQRVADGISALRAIATSPPDLLLLELKLPGLNGIDLLRKLRQSPLTTTLPVIVLTGSDKGGQYHETAKKLAVQHCLEKPFKVSVLLGAVRDALASSSGEAQPFAKHLRSAFSQRFSGQLVLTFPDTVRQLTFINGAPVALRPGFIHRDFGDFLCRRGQISEGEYQHYTSDAAFRHDSLVQIGCLRYSDLLQAEMDYLTEELVSAFGSASSRADWRAMPAPELLQLITLNVPQLFYAGFHKHPGQSARQLQQTCQDRFPVLVEDYYRHINFLRLNEAEKRLVPQLDGQKRLKELLPAGEDFGPLLLTLTCLDMLRFAREPGASIQPGKLPLRTLFNAVEEEADAAEEILESFSDLVKEATNESVASLPNRPVEPAPLTTTAVPAPQEDDLAQEVRLLAKSLEDKNHYEVFGIKPAKFSITLLKERYFAITRKFGPDILMQLGGKEAVLVEEILAKVATAYATLSDIVKKERYDEMLGSGRIGLGHKGDDRFQAQVQAESGKVFLEMEDWDSAEQALQEAVNFDSNNGDYLANLAWSVYRNPKYANSPAMQNKAKQMLNKALSMERTALAFAYKGWMLLESGQESMAEAEFNKALKLDARQMVARKGLRAQQELREQQKKGLFKRMFT